VAVEQARAQVQVQAQVQAQGLAQVPRRPVRGGRS
jgi:hypothetical protein